MSRGTVGFVATLALAFAGCGDDDEPGGQELSIEQRCTASCEHAEACGHPEFDRTFCEADCLCDTGSFMRADLVPEYLDCFGAAECGEAPYPIYDCFAEVAPEPPEANRAARDRCEQLVAAACPGETFCSFLGVANDDSVEAFGPCLELSSCEEAYGCLFEAAVGICPDLGAAS